MNRLLIDIRNGCSDHHSTNEHINSPSSTLTIESLFKLLRYSECVEDAHLIEEGIKEIWKAHYDLSIRWKLHDGIAHLLRGEKNAALAIYDRVIEYDPEYAEAWNKKATCHYVSAL